ncbi:39S ribosomal protein L17, mitochondrial [Leguminivora glycinivorella]|uniref:39S ribosomal protein L17, mitochondrial n=1 Tax=Leguminivora glycinivorella TaxID=1035111 RepID=UPI00200FF656|nr:39S ribosomal protein L17, mitochondrial [Leguminivora glycinivorella]
MNQAEVAKLVSKLRIKIPAQPRKLRNSQGPEGRLNKLRKTVTGLIKHERIELNYNRADEARQYAERLISDAIRYGDCHKPTMEIADYWLLEKELVHKLFKVLVPRYENFDKSYTRMHKAPRAMNVRNQDKAVLELRGNPYPSLINKHGNNRQLIQNILLDAAKYDYRQSKYLEMAEKIGKSDEQGANTKVESAQEIGNKN